MALAIASSSYVSSAVGAGGVGDGVATAVGVEDGVEASDGVAGLGLAIGFALLELAANGLAAEADDAGPVDAKLPRPPRPSMPPPAIICCMRAIAFGSPIIWLICCIIPGFCCKACIDCASNAGFCKAWASMGLC